jgi:N6-adenosine-specific RNA methylase IME4
MNTNGTSPLRGISHINNALLTEAERAQLRSCEEVVTNGLGEFIKVGVALHYINKNRLYRETHTTFNAYVQERWGVSRAQAYGLITVAEVVDNIQNGGGDVADLTVSKAKLLAQAEPQAQAQLAKAIQGKTVKDAKKIVSAAAKKTTTAKIVKHDPGPIPAVTPTVILADPPWQLKLGVDAPVLAKSASYNTMSVEEIKALGQKLPKTEKAHLYLWVTNHTLKQGFEVMESWGFEYLTTLTWVKRLGTGQGFRGSTEHVLIGRRGGLPFTGTSQGTWFEAEAGPGKSGAAFDGPPAEKKHSAKPDRLYEIIEAASPEGNRLELFARRQRPGWVGWGDQLFNDIAKGDDADEGELSQSA